MHFTLLALATAIGAAHAQSSAVSTPAILTVSPTPAACSSLFAGTIVQPSGQPQVTACPGSLALGETCGASEQCQNGAQCWASNAGLIRRCGNFNAACTRDEQCAYNTCNNGICNGFLAAGNSTSTTVSSSTSAPSSTPSCAAPGQYDSQGRYSCNPAHQYPAGNRCVFIDGCPVLLTNSTTSATTSMVQSTTTTGGPSSTTPPFTGDATMIKAASGALAVVAGVVAFVL